MMQSRTSDRQGVLVREDVRIYWGLSQVDVDILERLRTVSGGEGGWLAGEVGVSANAIGSRLSALVRRGLVYARWEDTRRRRPLWRLTDRGRELID